MSADPELWRTPERMPVEAAPSLQPDPLQPDPLQPDSINQPIVKAEPSDEPTPDFSLNDRSYVVPDPAAPVYYPSEFSTGDPTAVAAGPSRHALWPSVAPTTLPRLLPGVVDALLFVLLGALVLFFGMALCSSIGKHLPLFRNMSWEAMNTDARFNIPSMAVQYLALATLTALLFRLKWKRAFFAAIHWNPTEGVRYLAWLLPAGVGLALLVGLSGDYLPMPKNAPIVVDMMSTRTGAWMMFLFGFTAAPLMEELAFRGFLLPALINAFRSMEQRNRISAAAVRWIGVPLSITVTSLVFLILHSSQVSGAWGPLLIIGTVSVVLCIVRLRLNSVFASVLVHATYNFTLFVAMLVSTDGFRHLEKLNT